MRKKQIRYNPIIIILETFASSYKIIIFQRVSCPWVIHFEAINPIYSANQIKAIRKEFPWLFFTHYLHKHKKKLSRQCENLWKTSKEGKKKKIFKRENVYPNNLKSNYRINYTKHPAIFFSHRIHKKKSKKNWWKIQLWIVRKRRIKLWHNVAINAL